MSSKWIFMCFYFTLANKLILWSFSFFASPFQVRIGDVNAAPVTEVRVQREKHMLAKAMIFFSFFEIPFRPSIGSASTAFATQPDTQWKVF